MVSRSDLTRHVQKHKQDRLCTYVPAITLFLTCRAPGTYEPSANTYVCAFHKRVVVSSSQLLWIFTGDRTRLTTDH